MENSTGSSSSSSSRGLSPSSSPSSAFWSSPWTVTAVIACAILCCSLLVLFVTCILKRWRRNRSCSSKASISWGCCRPSAGDTLSGESNQGSNSSLVLGGRGMSLSSLRNQLAIRRVSGGHNGYGCLKEEGAADNEDCAEHVLTATCATANTEPVASVVTEWQQQQQQRGEQQQDFARVVGSTGAYRSLPSEPPKIYPPPVVVQTSHMRPTVVAAIAMHRHRESSLTRGAGSSALVAGTSTRQPYERLSEESGPADDRSVECGGEPVIVFSRRTAL